MFNEETQQLFLSIMFGRLQTMCKNLEFNVNKKMMSRWGMSDNQLIRGHNNGNEAIMEQMQNIQLLQSNTAFEEPKDPVAMMTTMVEAAKQPLTFDPVKDLSGRVDSMEAMLKQIAKKVGA